MQFLAIPVLKPEQSWWKYVQIQIKSYTNVSPEPSGLPTWRDPCGCSGQIWVAFWLQHSLSWLCRIAAEEKAPARSANQGSQLVLLEPCFSFSAHRSPTLAAKDFPTGNSQNKPFSSQLSPRHHHVHSQRRNALQSLIQSLLIIPHTWLYQTRAWPFTCAFSVFMGSPLGIVH